MSHDDVGAPATRLQRTIAEVWREVLELDALGVNEDFFELGGDSLAAVHMLAAIEDLLLAQVSFIDFIDQPTVASLADAVQQTRGQTPPVGPVLERGAGAGAAPCSFAQERLWFVDQLAGSTGAYNESLGTRIRGSLNVAALESGLQGIVQRHAALRTAFTVEDGIPTQLVDAEAAVELESIDLIAALDPETELRRVTEDFASRPFDLSRAPLMRAVIVTVGPEDHVLQLVFHHIICDGLSHVVVLRELGDLYRAATEGHDPQPPAEAPLQYADFARWQRERLRGEALEQAIAPWRERLADIPAAIDLPTDHPRPPISTYRGASRQSRLSAGTSERIRAFARAEGTTPFSTLLAGFDVVLARYSGQETIMVGSAMAGRDRPELEDLVGLFVNTVALRNDVSGNPTFRELLHRVGRVVLDAVAHQDAPFERLVAELQQQPDLSRHPIFQVYLTMRPRATLDLPGAEPYPVSSRNARTDLTLWVEEGRTGYELEWEYSTDLFEASTIEALERHFIHLLEAALEEPDRQIDELPMLDTAERDQLLVQSRPVQPDYPVACMHRLFEQQVELRPDEPAVLFDGAALSYRELNERANRLAHRLRELGVGPETMVALFLERSFDLVVSILAVLKAGGAYVPLDPESPAARVAFVLGDTAAPVLLTQKRLVDRLPDNGASVLCLDGANLGLEHLSPDNPVLLTTPESLAYVIYTSGSTGQPKGVQVEHRQVARLFTATEHWYGFGPADVWVLAHSYAFDVSVWELWGALAHGGRIVVSPFWVTRSPDAFAALVAQHGVTVLCATPSLFSSVQEELLRRADDLVIRYVVFAGEALQPASLRPWFDRFGDGGAALVNMYGITETTVHSSYRVMRAADCERDASPVGVPIPDLSLYLLDPHGEPVPTGVAGEIYVGGEGVTRGYLNRPELNAQRFLQNPFEPGRLYRSGDLARRLADGEISFLGRMDDQVKVRGFRIELGEVKTVIEEHEAVAESAVIAVKLTPEDVRLAAYVVPDEPLAAQAQLRESLRAALENRLPAYMVPSAIMFLDELPLTTNGKLDRRALPAPEWESLAAAEFVSPRTATEELLAAIWREIIGVERVGADDNFFELGGHSLLAARVVTQVSRRLGVDLSVRTVFERPTLAALAAQADSLRGEGSLPEAESNLVPAVEDMSSTADAGMGAAPPASFQQASLLYFEALDPGSSIYNAPLAFRADGPFDPIALRTALRGLVERHEALRTVFDWGEGEGARQVVLDEWELELEELDLTQLAPDEASAQLERLLREHAARPFDLRRDLMLRASVFRLSELDHVILLASHHIVLDAWTVDVLYRELGALYAAARARREPDLPPPSLQYRQFAGRQRERLKGQPLERELDFWRAQLAGAPPVLRLPTDRPRPGEQTFDGDTLHVELPADVVEPLRHLCQALQLTPYMLLLGVFTTLLYRRTGDDDILLGGPMAGRADPDLESLVGFCATTNVVRVRLGGNPALTELLGAVRESVLASYEHQEIPLELVVDAVRPERVPGVNPLFQVNFRVRVGLPPAPELDGLRTSAVPIELPNARFDLAAELHVGEQLIAAQFNYNTALFDRSTIEALADDFAALLHQVLADPDQRLLAFALPERVAVSAVDGLQGDAPAGGIRGFRRAVSR